MALHGCKTIQTKASGDYITSYNINTTLHPPSSLTFIFPYFFPRLSCLLPSETNASFNYPEVVINERSSINHFSIAAAEHCVCNGDNNSQNKRITWSWRMHNLPRHKNCSGVAQRTSAYLRHPPGLIIPQIQIGLSYKQP